MPNITLFALDGSEADVTVVASEPSIEGGTVNIGISLALTAVRGTGAPPDTTPPTVNTIVADSGGGAIDVTLSEATTGGTTGAGGFTVAASGGAGPTPLLAFALRSGNLVEYSTDRLIHPSETVTITYAQPGSNKVQDGAGNLLAGFGPSAVDLSGLANAGVFPILTTAVIDTTGTQLTVTLSQSCTGGVTGNGGFTLTMSGGAVAATYASGTGVTRVYTLSRSVLKTETGTLTYTYDGVTGDLYRTSNVAYKQNSSGSVITNNSTVSYNVLAHTFKAGGSNGGVASPAIDTTGANKIIVGVAYYNGPGTAVVAGDITDSKGNTYTALNDYSTTLNGGVRLFYCDNPTVGTGHTFTVSKSSEYPSLFALAVSGATTGADQQAGTSNQAGATIQPGSITPGFANELIVTVMYTTSTAAPTIGSGFTIADSIAYNSGVNIGGALAYKIQTAAAAINPTWTVSNAATQAACQASFKAA